LSVGSRSPQRYRRFHDRYFRFYDQITWGDQHQHAQELFADFEEILFQLTGDLLAKEDILRLPTPIGIHLDNLSIEFNYVSQHTKQSNTMLYSLC
jgi:hypothetical protein